MPFKIPFVPEQASSFAQDVDHLTFALVAMSTFFTVLISIMVVVFAVRYRRRSPEAVGSGFNNSMLLEVTWKLTWLGLVALPASRAGDLDPAMSEILVNCSFVVVIIVVVPWRHVWRAYVRAGGARWR